MDVEIEFISANMLRNKGHKAKIDMIINLVRKEKKIVVLEEGLTNVEQNELIEKTMTHVSTDFPGIEIASFGTSKQTLQTSLIKLLGGKTIGMSVVGPSNVVRQIKQNPEKFELTAGGKK